MKRLLVTGASGLLGLNLAVEASNSYDVTAVVHRQPLTDTPFQIRVLDLNHFEEAARLIEDVRPDAIINCAAMTDIDAVELDPAPAWHLNAEFPGFLAQECLVHGIQLVQISTDAVFNGQRGNYVEEDLPTPLSAYARTKLAGEQAVLSTNPNAIVSRVVFYGWSLSGKRSLAEWFYYNLTAGNDVNGFTDIYFCPLLVNQLAGLLLMMLDRGLSGLYHVVSRDSISKYGFGSMLAQRLGLNAGMIRPVSYHEGNLAAPRSPSLTLRTDKLARDLGKTLPDVRSGIEQFYELYHNGYRQRILKFSVQNSYP